MFERKRIVVAIHLFALIHLSLARMFAQADPATADQVIARYMEAVGADRFSSITTFAERGELYGNLTNFWQGSRAPAQSLNKEHGTFELYFKAPNLRFSSTLTAGQQVISLHGCDGRVSWYINSHLERSEFKPKPEKEYDCETGFEPMPAHLRQSNVKMQLTKKKAVEGRSAWEIKVDDPKSVGSESYYFDAETYFLLRLERRGSKISYADYRDVGGIKLPFTTTNEFANSKLVTTVREIKVNAPIDDARFAELQSKGGTVSMDPAVAPRNTEASSTALPNAPTAPNAEMATAVPPILPAKPNTTSLTEVNFPNFTSCTIAELQQIVPELNGLKPARDQEKLATLLEKVGTKTVDIARHTPNLISRETVTELQQGVAAGRRDYDYLILTHPEGNVVALNEFRVDLKTGDKFQTDEGIKNDSSTLAALEHSSRELAKSSGRPPASQGFATSWVDFYPLNRPQASFRYLGEQKINHQHTLVLAFAQKPQSVLSPALFRGQDKSIPMFLQGVAWVDASDFRIVRLRTDLLEPLPEVSLHRLTADVQFLPTRIEGVASTLSLPREVMITSEIGGATLREDHLYSEYRLFRAKSRIVLDP